MPSPLDLLGLSERAHPAFTCSRSLLHAYAYAESFFSQSAKHSAFSLRLRYRPARSFVRSFIIRSCSFIRSFMFLHSFVCRSSFIPSFSFLRFSTPILCLCRASAHPPVYTEHYSCPSIANRCLIGAFAPFWESWDRHGFGRRRRNGTLEPWTLAGCGFLVLGSSPP